MNSESSDRLAQGAMSSRRTDTPPRSIFDDYQSAYQSIISSARTFTGTSTMPDDVNTFEPAFEREPSQPNNPFADLSPRTVSPMIFPRSKQPGSFVAPRDRGASYQLSSAESKCRTNFSRPMNLLPACDQVARPASAAIHDSVAIFNLDRPRQMGDYRSLNTEQPNCLGAHGEVEKSSMIGTIVKSNGHESSPTRRSSLGGHDVATREPIDIIACGQGMFGRRSINPGSCPVGQPPIIPLPPDPCHVAARGLADETFSEASLYENTEKLLNLTQTNETGAPAERTESGLPASIADRQASSFNCEFSWMGAKGKTSFRDLSAKELKQLRNSTYDQPKDVANRAVDMPPGRESYDNQYLLTNEVYHPSTANQISTGLDKLVEADADGAELLPEHLATYPSQSRPSGNTAIRADDEDTEADVHTISKPQTDSVTGFGGLQSCSSRGVSLDFDLRDGPFKPGLYNHNSSRTSLIVRESADVARLSPLINGDEIIRGTENHIEDDMLSDADEDEGGEWETVGESGTRSKLETQASMGRDTSGSSLANVSSNGSVNEDDEDNRPALSPWDPLRSVPVLITPPTNAVLHQQRIRYIPDTQGPLTVPRYTFPDAEGQLGRKQNRILSSTPSLTFSATPQYPQGTGFPTYRHPTPLRGEHQNPFTSPPPLVNVQSSGGSFELREFSDNKYSNKRQTIHSDCSRPLQPQIHNANVKKTQDHLHTPFVKEVSSSDRSVDGSYSTTNASNLAMDGSSILNPNSPHTPKSVKSFTKGSIKKTNPHFTGSPIINMSESRRYQRLREEMGCGTSGIVRVPGNQQVAPPSAHLSEERISPIRPYRATNPFVDLPEENSFGLTFNEPLTRSSTDVEIARRMIMANDDMNILRNKCPTFPLTDQMLKTTFRSKDGTMSTYPKAKRGTVLEQDGRLFEQAYCEVHDRWEFSHTPHLTRRTPKDDVKIQREMGRKLILYLFLSILGWLPLIFMIAFDPGHVRDDIIREYTKGAVSTFHQKEIVIARQVTVLIAVIIAVVLTLVGLKLE